MADVELKQVKATAEGYYLCPRAAGDIFEIPVHLTGTWFDEVAAPASVKVADRDADLA